MDFESKYNTKIPAVKRLMREACELREPTEDYSASPLEENLFEWHFTVKGANGTEFEGGVYHGRIIFPNEYPMKPPNIILLTPNGRFEINKKICLSISGHHPETWQPSWSIRTALLALIAFMPSEAKGTIGSLDYTPEERKVLAKKSQQWKCNSCGHIAGLLGENISNISLAESQMIKSVTFKAEIMGAKSSSSAVQSDKSSVPNLASSQSESRNEEQAQATTESPLEHSGFCFEQRTADCLIAAIVFALAFLIYRRFF